jgi:predicted amidohydrolase
MEKRPEPYIAAVVQFGVEAFFQGDDDSAWLEKNRDNMLRWVKFLCEGAEFPAKLLVFPIVTLDGSSARPTPPNRTRFNLVGPLEPILDPLVAACARYGCYLALSVLEEHPALPGDYMHTAVVLDGNGLVLRQPKFIPHTADEIPGVRERFYRYLETVGEDGITSVVETPIGRLAGMLDRDLLIPELGRARAKKNAEVVVHPSLGWPGEVARSQWVSYGDLELGPWHSWPDEDVPFKAMRQTMAYQNCFFLLTANHGYERWQENGKAIIHQGRGGSMIAGPDGRVLAECSQSGEGYAIATIDVTKAAAAREEHGAVTLPIWDIYNLTYR